MSYVAYAVMKEPGSREIGDIIIGNGEKRTKRSIAVRPFCRMAIGDGEAHVEGGIWNPPVRVPLKNVIAEADTLLGIVVRVERFRNTHNAVVPGANQ